MGADEFVSESELADAAGKSIYEIQKLTEKGVIRLYKEGLVDTPGYHLHEALTSLTLKEIGKKPKNLEQIIRLARNSRQVLHVKKGVLERQQDETIRHVAYWVTNYPQLLYTDCIRSSEEHPDKLLEKSLETYKGSHGIEYIIK
jgi:hypothetical protein